MDILVEILMSGLIGWALFFLYKMFDELFRKR